MMSAAQAQSSQRRNPLRIALVEDEPGDVYLLEKVLRNQNLNYELTLFEDGDAALRGLAGEGGVVPDLILLDLNLPKRDGFEILRAIRSRPALVGVPIGIFTSSEAVADRSRVSLLGAERYIHKPPELQDFVEQVGSAISDLLTRL
jgi:CheY-like chemotaxis protein